MGVCCFQERSREQPSRTIRVVHVDGFLEDYESPATVDQIIGYFSKHFLTTPIQIMQIGLVPLRNDTQLEPGRIYFLLPYSMFRFNETSGDLMPLAKKLINIARTRQSMPKPAPPPSAIPQNKVPSHILLPKVTNIVKTPPSKAKPPRSPSTQDKGSRKISLTRKLSNIARAGFKDPSSPSTSSQDKGSSQSSDGSSNIENTTLRRSNKMMSWKPLLATIREISFNRRESDLRD